MHRKIIAILLLCLSVVAMFSGAAYAQTGGGFDLSWQVIGGGGGQSAGGSFTVDGTVGQAVVGSSARSGYTVDHGFWTGAAIQVRLLLPLVLKGIGR
jgi:hypothetical protein